MSIISLMETMHLNLAKMAFTLLGMMAEMELRFFSMSAKVVSLLSPLATMLVSIISLIDMIAVMLIYWWLRWKLCISA
ncbi:hypothetical protein K0M31_002269 [Melipona bicolor]|uniref:Uncharacterized protein n=1 Tax=Melipona bicolor TaxID=60889 RepID=A0AA40GH87_9HYME|nr:hypothetical protein K0M31_002269 [Melipona bicolor]